MANLAPIVLFVYNRPLHTQQTLDALSKNDLAKSSDLYVYCDGPKSGIGRDGLTELEETRIIVKNEKRFKSITIVESDSNKGLADSIIQGVTEIVNRFGKIIVLEDDIVTSPGFLRYMNDALNVYKSEEKVMHVSGYMYPVKTKLPETFFIGPTSCWGWGTWKRAWDFFEKNVDKQIGEIEKNQGWNEFTLDGGFKSYKKQLFLNQSNEINTWAIFWYASVFLNNGISLHPYPSLVQNIGFDGSGINCGNSLNSPYTWDVLANKIAVKKNVKLKINSKISRILGEYFMKNQKKEKDLSVRDKFYIYRQQKYNFVKDVLNLVFRYRYFKLHKLSQNILENNEKEVLRYEDGITDFKGGKLNYIDYASYKSTLHELFHQKIYSFHSEKDNPIIIDCGANIGLSVLFFKEIYPNCQIIAFEADPKVFSCLRKNVESFKLKNVELINKALWDIETNLTFYSEGADGGRIDEKTFGNGEIINVKTTCLSKYLNQPIDFLKIDIEGAEYKVLLESKDLLKNVKSLFVEYHSFTNRKQHLDEILEILSTSGFRYYISSIGVKSEKPFLNIKEVLGMDNQLNIFAYR